MTNNDMANEYITLFIDNYNITNVNDDDINEFFTDLVDRIIINEETVDALNIAEDYIRKEYL